MEFFGLKSFKMSSITLIIILDTVLEHHNARHCFMYILLLLDLQINTSSQESIVTKTDDLIKKYILSRSGYFYKLHPLTPLILYVYQSFRMET